MRSPVRVSIKGKRHVYKMSRGLSLGGMGNKEEPRKENNRGNPVREEKSKRVRHPGNQLKSIILRGRE